MNDLRLPILVIYAASGLATLTDLRRFRVSNALTLPLLLTGLIYHALIEGWPGLGQSLAGAGFGLAALMLPYAAGGMGAGDVKFLSAVGAWLGLPMTYHVLIASAIAGGLYALILTIATGRLRETWMRFQSLATRKPTLPEDSVARVVTEPNRRQRLVPFAAMVALGLVATIARSHAGW